MQDEKIYGMNYTELNKILEIHRQSGKSVIMCSGTFDLFHLGHMNLLAAAKKQGDILIVTVKSDRGAALKKADPPVLDQNIRMQTVSHCISADYVCMADFDPTRKVSLAFENLSSYQWLNMFEPVVATIRPDIFVHEDNTTIANARKVLFEQYNVTGVIQPRTEGISTTEIIDRIKTRYLKELQNLQ